VMGQGAGTLMALHQPRPRLLQTVGKRHSEHEN